MLLVVVLLLSILPTSAFAATVVASGYCGGEGDGINLTWELTDDGTLTISGTGAMEDYDYDTTPWRFSNSIKSVIIDDGVTLIGDYAFYYCSSLTTVTIPSSVTIIGNYAFYGCYRLTTVTIPNSVTIIGEAAFCTCSSLKSVTIPNSVTTIGDRAFSQCNLTTVTIPNSVATIGDHAFSRCSLTTVTIPNSVTTIGDGAFSNCSKLQGIVVAEGNRHYADLDGVLLNYAKTEILCFPDGRGDTTYIIPDGVTTIGNRAFSPSNSLTTVIIPDGVTSIGEYAFYSCRQLTTVTLPNTVTSIGMGAFYDCVSLTTMTIPNSVTTIGNDAFYGCWKLTTVTLPNTVTSIGMGAFCRCVSLTTMTIPNSVTTIGNTAFYGCESLTTVTIPDSVTTIGNAAFNGCTKLTSVYFKGNAPTSIGSDIFSSGATIYYIPGTSGWTDSDAYNAAAGTWNGYKLATWSPALQQVTNAPTSKYAIIVQDSQGNSLEGVEVSWENFGTTEKEVTSKDGVVYFDKTSAGEPVITASKANYISYSTEGTNYAKSEKGYDIITLYSKDEGEYRLSSATFKNYLGIPTDVLKGTKRLSMSNKRERFSLYTKAPAGDITNYILKQGNEKIAEAADGNFENFTIDRFQATLPVSVVVVNAAGAETETPINLQFVADKPIKATGIQLGGEKVKFTLGNDIPFVGGQTLEFAMPYMPVDTYISDDTIHIGVNMDLSGEDHDARTQKIKEVNKLFNRAMSTEGRNFKSRQKQINYLMQDKNKKAQWGGLDTSLSFIGYGEGKFDENGWAEVKVHFCLIGEASNTLQGPTVWVVIAPVTYSVNLSAKGELTTEFSYDLNTQTTNGDLSLTITPGLKAFGGVGIGKAVGAGAYGSAKMPFELQLIGTSIKPGLNYVDLTGELGLKAYLGPLVYEKPYFYNTWHLYTRTGYSKQTPMMLRAAPATVDLTDESQYYLDDLSYLEDQSEWLGYGGGISLFSVTSDTATANELTPLQIGTYRNMQPVIGAAGETPVMVWVTANTDRGDYNYPQLVYSVYQYGAWQEPMPVDDNDTLDSAHALYTAADGTLWLVYQDTAEGYNTADLSDFAANQTIRVARFDAITGGFTDFVTLSEPGIFGRTPVITEVDGVTTALWVSNSDNSYFGENTTNTLCYAQYENGTWGEAKVLASGLNAVTETAIGNHNGVLSASVITDGDNDLSTTEDRTLWLYDGLGQAQEIANGSISAVTYAQLPSAQVSDLLWSNGSSLIAHDTGAVFENSALAGGFTVLSDRVIYNGADGEDKSNLFAQIYDNGTWSVPVHVTVQEQYLQSYAAAEIGGQTYLAAAQAVVDITADSVDETCTLSWAVLSGRTDAAITAVDVDYSAEAPSAEVPVYVDVANLGDTTISEYTVTIGTEVSETISTALAPGEEATVELVLPLGKTVTTTDYTVTVIAENDGDDTNDTSTVTIGHSDLAVYTEFLQAGENRTMLVKVANEGAVSADGTLSVTSESGDPKTVTVDALEPGEFSLYRIEVTSDLLGGAQAGLLTATVTPNATEWNEFNDQSTTYVEVYTPTAEISASVEKTSMVLGNDLSIMFAFTADDIAGTGNYAVITKSYADGTADRVERFEQSAWGDPIVIGGKNYYAISFDGVAAKEMTDEVQVQIFNAVGEPISEVYTDSLRDYAMRMINQGVKTTMFVDMLVYGAEAQKQFNNYAIEDLAISQLTAEQLAQATQMVSCDNNLEADSGYRASSVILESNIKLVMLFGGVDQTMTAEVSFNDHYGNAKSYTVSGSEFTPVTYKGEACYSVTVDALVVADGRQPVSITVKDADGNVVTSATDSVESYIARMSSTGTLYESIMKFSDSAAAGLKN